MKLHRLIWLTAIFAAGYIHGQRSDSYFYHTGMDTARRVHFARLEDTSSTVNNDIFFGTCDSFGVPRQSWLFGGSGSDLIDRTIVGHTHTYLLGTTTSYGFGFKDALVIRYSNKMDSVEAVVFGETNADLINFIYPHFSDSSALILGRTESGVNNYDLILCEMDSNMAITNRKIIQIAGNESAAALIVDSRDSSIYIAGRTDLNDGGGKDILAIKLNRHFAHQWSRVIYDPDDQELNDLELDKAGNLYLLGYADNSWYNGVAIKLDTGGNVVWKKRYESTIANRFFRSLFYEDHVYIGGVLSSLTGSGEDFFALKMDTLGDVNWSAQLPYADDEYMTSLNMVDSMLVGGGPALTSGGWGNQVTAIGLGGSSCQFDTVPLTIYDVAYSDSLLPTTVDSFDMQQMKVNAITVYAGNTIPLEACLEGLKEDTDTTDGNTDSTGVASLSESGWELHRYLHSVVIKNDRKENLSYRLYNFQGQLLRSGKSSNSMIAIPLKPSRNQVLSITSDAKTRHYRLPIFIEP